jgi:hypothetical protein
MFCSDTVAEKAATHGVAGLNLEDKQSALEMRGDT